MAGIFIINDESIISQNQYLEYEKCFFIGMKIIKLLVMYIQGKGNINW